MSALSTSTGSVLRSPTNNNSLKRLFDEDQDELLDDDEKQLKKKLTHNIDLLSRNYRTASSALNLNMQIGNTCSQRH